jgi:hypothetical protein
MSARTDADSVAVGEPVSLTVQVQGIGNLTTLSPPQLNLPSVIDAYEPDVETDVERNGREIRGTKTFAYTLVPRTGGRHALPPVSFSYFDPETGRYETLRAEVSPLRVSGTASRATAGRTGDGLPVGDVTDLMTADEADWGPTERRPLHRQPWAYLALLLPVLIAGGGLVYRRRRRTADPTESPASDVSLDTAQAQLREARRRLGDGGDAAVYDTVEQALQAFLNERLGRNGTASTRSQLDQRLARHDVPAALRDRLYELLDRCDEGKYAPTASAQSAPEELVDDAHSVLRWLDEHLPSATRPSGRP